MKKIAALVMLSVLIVAGCNKYSTDFSGIEKEAKGKFIGMMGVGFFVPGVTNFHDKYAQAYDVIMIPGTSDVIESPKHLKYVDAAYAFAEAHNNRLIEKITSEQEAAPLPSEGAPSEGR